MNDASNQITLFSIEQKEDCYSCNLFAELKKPLERSDGAIIYGYCFKCSHNNYSPNMGKGFAVFAPEGACKEHKRKKEGE